MSKTTQYWPVICSYFEYMRFELGLVKTTYPHNSRFDNAAIQPKNARQINWTTSCAKKSSSGQPHFFSNKFNWKFLLKGQKVLPFKAWVHFKKFSTDSETFLRHENIFQGSEKFFEQHEIFNFVRKDLLNLKMLCRKFQQEN